ncbi:MAG: hypothetical protein IKW58_01215 [Alphaproteobacteria bacterium]|jgi:hypothetical protein|nr:hypothetical protein [Alphaproteobacteria bacterium]
MLKKLWNAIIARCEGTSRRKQEIAQGVKDGSADFVPKKPIEEINDWMKDVKLTPSQITDILNREKEDRVMLEVLRNNKLDPAQEEILVSKRNTLLLETYISPQGYLEPSRTLSPKAEFAYILSMLDTKKTIGIELFKIYVDNAKKTIMTDAILEKALEVINASSDETEKTECFAAKYLLSKAYLNEEQEQYLLNNANPAYIDEYINSKALYHENSQILLIEKYFNLAKLHQEQYGLRAKALQLFHAKRKEELQLLHPEGAVP